MWPGGRRAATLLALGLTALVLACGSESDEDQIRSTLEDFAAANLDGEWSEACALMTERTKKVLTRLGAVGGANGCEATLETGVGELSEAQKERDFENIEITTIEVNGTSATAEVNGETGRLTKQGEQWLIDIRG